ncbi:MAG: anti-sigma factor family protein [Gemmatimonadales bacterium]
MPTLDRMVAGIRCREVLAELSDYTDGLLSDERVAQIHEHLRRCDWCERFGGEFAAVVKSFHEALAQADPVSPEVERRLRERLRRELAAGRD